MSYQIGDYVQVKDTDKLAECENRLYNSRTSRRSGMQGTIVDRLYSEANDRYVYYIMFDGETTASRCKFIDEEIELATISNVEFRISRNGNRMEAFLCKEDGTVIECAYGNIRFDNVMGITQAASHAMRTIYHKMKGDIQDDTL